MKACAFTGLVKLIASLEVPLWNGLYTVSLSSDARAVPRFRGM
jgi:hypothetical protein